MTIIQGILYGFLQGVTEFLPVSSSGHLALAQNFFGGSDLEGSYLAFTVFLHLGTLAAVIAVYYKDVWEMIKGFFTLMGKLFTGKIKNGLTKGERLFLLVLTATLPLILAVPFEDKVGFLSSLSWAIGVFLIINGVILYAADRLSKVKLSLDTARPRHAVAVGLIQLIAIIPGISRSGSTITGGMIIGLKKTDAVKLSFLMSIPAIAGANLFELISIKEHPLPAGSYSAVACGVLAAVVSGLVAIKLLQYMAKNKKMSVFSLYCVLIGAAAIIADLLK